jgi:DNA polymerase-3 subunit epsilon
MVHLARYDMIQFFKQLSGRLGSNIYAGFQGNASAQNIAFIRALQKEMKQNNSLDCRLNELRIVVFDIETTGFYPDRGDKILSIGAVKMTGANIHNDQTFYSLLKSDTSISTEILELTGIRQDALLAAPPPLVVLLRFFKFIQSNILVAHHSQHEQSFMQKMTWELLRTKFEHRVIDTSFLTRITDPHMKSLPLEELCTNCGINIKNRHHALGDAKMTAQIWAYYLRLAEEKGFTTLREVYEFIAKLS